MKVITQISKWLSMLGSLLMRVAKCLMPCSHRGRHTHYGMTQKQEREVHFDRWEDFSTLTGGDEDELSD